MATTDTDLYRSVMGNDFKATLIKYRPEVLPGGRYLAA